MARPGARARIEQALAALQSEGRPATVRALRERAGEGSFSTVLAVLRASRLRERTAYAPVHKDPVATVAPPLAAATDPPGDAFTLPSGPGAAAAAEPVQPAGVRAASALVAASASGELSHVHAALEQLSADVVALSDELRASRQAHAAELALAYERYESVQKYALREVDSARERAQDAQRALRELQAGIRTREDVFLQQAARLREELAFVRGELAEARAASAGRTDR
jgi:hypothetical protein